MARARYQPDRGHLVFMDFSPQAGTEQAGRRPALVLSPLAFNVGTGLAFVCPITHQAKGGGFEVPLPAGAAVSGVILSDQMRSLDWIARNFEFRGTARGETLDHVLARIEAILGLGSP